MSQAEIRAQLAAMGYPTDALDDFLSGGPIDPNSAFDPAAIGGLQMLGVIEQGADGLEIVETVSGLKMGEAAADSLEESPVFGHDVFRRATSRFQPLLSGPVSDDYQLGPGDQLLLLLTGEAELAHELVVTREGFVVVPEVGRISIANLTMSEVRTLFRDRFAGFYSGIRRGTTTVNVTITELRTIQIYLSGEVGQPGAYQLSSVATVTNALYAANGPTDLGNLRDVRIRRRDGSDSSLDLYPYLLEGDVSGDITLEQGDVIFVPLKERRVQLNGAVIRPKHYELDDDDDLFDVLSAAGGFAPEANRRRMTVFRATRPGDRGPGLSDRIAIDLGLAPSDDRDQPNHVGGVVIPPVGLQDGDSIVVDSLPLLNSSYYVTIAGMVAQPDTFPWHEGMTIRDLVQLARGPITGADLRQAEVSRLPDARGLGELADRLFAPLDSSYLSQRSADGRYVGPPGVAFPPAGSSPEFSLHPYDQVQIHRQPEFDMPKSVKITGEVAVPGEYTLLSKEARVTGLIDRAGGILETGYLEGARLYRAVDEMGRIDLHLVEAVEVPEGDENVLLQPGDSLHIPQYTPTVVVQGAVNSPVTVLFREGQDFGYYIAAAGGFRNDADKGGTAVRFANGLARTRSKFLFWSSYPEPDAGSVITVPARPTSPPVDKTQLIVSIVGIVGSIATTIAVVVTR
jgi:protein involved in polysaccharide export with SLBB domain